MPLIRIFGHRFSQIMEVTVMAPNHVGGPLGSILGPMGSHWVQKMGQNRKKFSCPKIRLFDYPAVIDFSQKMEVTVMAPNHGGDTLESILGPMGSHWVQKMGRNRKKLPCPKLQIFDFFAKNGIDGYGAKSRWAPLRVHLGANGANGVPLGPKMGQNRKKLPCPQIRIFDYPAVIDFSQIMEVTVMTPNHGGDTIESILGPMRSHWVQKMGRNRKKLPCPKLQIFDFFAKNGIYGYGAKSRWAPLRVHLGANGANGVPLGPKMGQNRKKLPCPQIRIFDYPAVIDFSQIMEVTVMTPNHGGDTIESILGPMRSHWVQKMGRNRKKLPCPEIRIFDYPAVIGFSQKMEVTVMTPNHRGDHLGSILGPMGSHWVKKCVKTEKKLTCPKIRIFDYPTVIGFSQKMEVKVMAPNHGGDTIESILGPMGSHWVQKMGQNRKKITMPKNSNFRLPRGHRFFPKNGSYGYGAKSRRGHPKVDLGASGVPLGPKNVSKP